MQQRTGEIEQVHQRIRKRILKIIVLISIYPLLQKKKNRIVLVLKKLKNIRMITKIVDFQI